MQLQYSGSSSILFSATKAWHVLGGRRRQRRRAPRHSRQWARSLCAVATPVQVEVNDISLEDYLAVKPKFARYTTHSAGRFQTRRFRKAQCPIVERCAGWGLGGGCAASRRGGPLLRVPSFSSWRRQQEGRPREVLGMAMAGCSPQLMPPPHPVRAAA